MRRAGLLAAVVAYVADLALLYAEAIPRVPGIAFGFLLMWALVPWLYRDWIRA